VNAAATASAPRRRLTLAGLAGLREAGAPVRERLLTMLFLAGIAHGIVILGLSFGSSGRPGSAPGMEVLLVTEDLPEARRNDRAAYLAQRTQIGSGNTRTQRTGSPEAQAAAANVSLIGALEQLATSTAGAGNERTLATAAPSPTIVWFGQAGEQAAATAMERAFEAGSRARHGRGDAPELVLRGDPRTGQWLSPDTRASSLAPYLDAWRRKVERVGTLNFPTAAQHDNFSGSPVIEVALGSDGRLVEATIQRSSGHAEIDAAALQILRIASPFEPFPPALARRYGAVRFAYQWEFSGGGLQPGTVSAGADAADNP
jgi:periplasmic protein TonB